MLYLPVMADGSSAKGVLIAGSGRALTPYTSRFSLVLHHAVHTVQYAMDVGFETNILR